MRTCETDTAADIIDYYAQRRHHVDALADGRVLFVLSYVANLGTTTLARLSADIGQPMHVVSGFVSLLENAGLVHCRETGEVVISPEGAEFTSAILKAPKSAGGVADPVLRCVTEGTHAQAGSEASDTTPARWTLGVYLSLFNTSAARLVVDDAHARVYVHAKTLAVREGEQPDAGAEIGGNRRRLTLGCGNTLSTRAFELDARSALRVHIAFEASALHGERATVAFGLFFDGQVPEGGELVRIRAPSDRIYIFQTSPTWATRAHFVSHDRGSIDRRFTEAKTGEEKAFWASLLQAAEWHSLPACKAPAVMPGQEQTGGSAGAGVRGWIRELMLPTPAVVA